MYSNYDDLCDNMLILSRFKIEAIHNVILHIKRWYRPEKGIFSGLPNYFIEKPSPS
jgi:hypothetical protein